ncbi:hypothetical protein C5167_049722 [Papaver somniferum]|uniref:Origin of replication complex subunit 4 n=1 Tax=Papaver somniferum TaxID=3469 RepID=A0A4Y7KQ37_PAPSO|nr:origin of replication complex subunit 4-like isoform X1 [Papaver somniferum]RZC74241.1 hypothetical protein C5167_049722 [Papaver somniferum]
MELSKAAEKALILLRSRICNPNFVFSALSDKPDSNYSKLKFLLSSSVTESCNNSVLLLGPRGCGKIPVLELVLQDLQSEHPETVSVVRLNGILHSDDNYALKEIARQLCLEHDLEFSKMASSDDNSQFMIAMLQKCGLDHRTLIFVLDEFDLFTQGKQRLLYCLLDAMQSVMSQAVVVGSSCRLDADQLLEKRVRSRFSHRKLLFLPPSKEDIQILLEHILSLPADSNFPHDYVVEFNEKIRSILGDQRCKAILTKLSDADSSVNNLLSFLFRSICNMDIKESRFLSTKNFETASKSIHQQPKRESLQDCSILEHYILVCMKRLETKEQNSYNFNSVMKEYKVIHDAFPIYVTHYERDRCLMAFEHLEQHGLISFEDVRGQNPSVQFRSVKLLVSSHQLQESLNANSSSIPGKIRTLLMS